MIIYHVARFWDRGDLLSLARQIDCGVMDLDTALQMIADKWCDGCVRTAERYMDGDGHEVHCHATLAEAEEYRAEWCEGGEILAIETKGLEVSEGVEYPHPVVRDMIPAERITVLEVAR